MKRLVASFTAAGAFAVTVIVISTSLGAAQPAPAMGGGYTNVITIPVDDPKTKTIAGALFKPSGSGPFPAIVYMSGCAGLDIPPEKNLEKALIDHQLARGVAILIVDPFTPRSEFGMAHQGLCERISDSDLNEKEWAQNATRGGNDIVAAVKVLRSMTDIDPDRIFLQGYSIGAASSLSAVDSKTAGAHEVKIAGVIAYYPFCMAMDSSVPALILIGEKDDWSPAARCQTIKDRPNTEVVVYPGATHSFAYQTGIDYLGHHMVYDDGATRDAQGRADTFMDAHLK
jgi:dienelactone hydrolase